MKLGIKYGHTTTKDDHAITPVKSLTVDEKTIKNILTLYNYNNLIAYVRHF